MTDTRDKLLEAKYFLDCMKEIQSNRDAFKYNLSAFLSAARSVTLFMQKEFAVKQGFKDWYTMKQAEMEQDEEMKLLNDKRVMTIHQKSVKPHAHVKVGISQGTTVRASISIVTIHDNGSEEKRELELTKQPVPPKTESTIEWLWFFDELPDKDIVTVCNEHIAKLENLVTEYESKFKKETI